MAGRGAELAEAKRLISNLLSSTELADARAEIAVLQEQRDLEWAAVMMGKPVGPEAEAQFEQLKADAKIGELAQGMGTDTRLTKGGMLYKAETKQVGKWVKTYPDRTMFLWNDLIDALRSIQEVDDG